MITRLLARPAVVDWLIRRAQRTPYFHITGADGSVYMERYWLFNPYDKVQKSRWRGWLPSIRLHRIVREDRDRHLHDHPWDARTVILRGWYIEERRVESTLFKELVARYRRRAGDTATLRFGEYHRSDEGSSGGVWTLCITFKYRCTWGFLVDGKKVPWREYLGISKETT